MVLPSDVCKYAISITYTTKKYTKSRLNCSYLDNVHDDTGRHHPQAAQQIWQQDLRSDDVRALRQEAMSRTGELAGETSELLPLITELQL